MIKNPQAFPSDFECGMTLRDYFAAKAMQSVLSSAEWMVALRHEVKARGGNTDDASALADMAYDISDAMLKERAK